MKLGKDGLTLSTGRSISANRGIIGLDTDGELYEGYDGPLSPFGDPPLADAEKIEIADFMIARWVKFREVLSGEKVTIGLSELDETLGAIKEAIQKGKPEPYQKEALGALLEARAEFWESMANEAGKQAPPGKEEPK